MHPIEPRSDRRTAVAAGPFLSGAREDRKFPGRIDLQHPFSAGHLNDVTIARAIEIDSERSMNAAIRRIAT
jgi:hypothetical protein